MASRERAIPVAKIVFLLAFIGAGIPAVNAAVPCCPIFADYDDYYYPVDPFYMFPTYCSCPFLDDALERWEEWDIPDSYWEWVIDSGNGCATCGTGSTTSTFTYSNTALIIPEKDMVMTGYDKISISTSIMSKDQAFSKQKY